MKTQEASEVEEVREVKSLGIWFMILDIICWINERRVFATFFWSVVCTFPTSIYISARYFSEPGNFWHELILISLGFYLIGATQVFMGCIYILALLFVWGMDSKKCTWMDNLP